MTRSNPEPDGNSQESFGQAADNWHLEKLYTDLALAKLLHISPTARNNGLTETEKCHLRGLLCGKKPQEIATLLNMAQQSIRTALCNTIYCYVKELTNNNNSRIRNSNDIINWLGDAGYRKMAAEHCNPSEWTQIEWGNVPEANPFYGRTDELAILQQWIIEDRCNLVGLLGMGGIGKTACAIELIERIYSEFEYIAYRSVTPLPDPENPLVQVFPGEEIQDISRWLNHFRARRCLVILDSFETILNDNPVGTYREGFEIYGELLERVGEERHQSCLIVLSRENPRELRLSNSQSPIRTYQLTELQDASHILDQNDLLDKGGNWGDLVKSYGGNPLALKIIVAYIKESFGGSVRAFNCQQTTIFDPDLNNILNEQFNRLSAPEKEVLLRLATTPQPFSRRHLLSSISTVSSQSELSTVLCSLHRRSLIEQQFETGEIRYTLPQVIMKFARRMLS